MNRHTKEIIISGEYLDVEEALFINRNADLRNANLRNANLRNADLRNADLRNADLSYADLIGANLRNADLRNADLRNADLRNADLRNADLSYADLRNADLRNADLRNANLRNADLSYADLSDADLIGAIYDKEYLISLTSICPDGDIIGYKKCKDNIIIKLLIPEYAKRSNATGRKCRASYVKVLHIYNGHDVAYSSYDNKTEYRKGNIVVADYWEQNRFKECAGGIHFFLTKAEAERY